MPMKISCIPRLFQSLVPIIIRTNVRSNAIVSGRASTASVATLAKNGVGQELPHSARPAREKSARVLFSFQQNERFPRSPNESPEVPLSGGAWAPCSQSGSAYLRKWSVGLEGTSFHPAAQAVTGRFGKRKLIPFKQNEIRGYHLRCETTRCVQKIFVRKPQ